MLGGCVYGHGANVLYYPTFRSRVDNGLLRRCLRISRGLSRGLVGLWDGSRYVFPEHLIKPELNSTLETVFETENYC